MDNIIKCPVCGQEYLPPEIFLPDNFFGSPGEVIRNESGQIDFITGSDMNLAEEYICDNCDTKFKVETHISFEVKVEGNSSYEEEYVSTFTRPKRIKLKEEDLFND